MTQKEFKQKREELLQEIESLTNSTLKMRVFELAEKGRLMDELAEAWVSPIPWPGLQGLLIGAEVDPSNGNSFLKFCRDNFIPVTFDTYEGGNEFSGFWETKRNFKLK